MKLRFYLIILKVIDVIEAQKSVAVIADKHIDKEGEDLASWEHNNYICRNYALNCSSLYLYDVY